MNPGHVIKVLRLTEKSNLQSAELGQYTFEVATGATKHAIAQAVEETFKVTVTRVNTQNHPGKKKRSRQGRPVPSSGYKKAIVTLKTGDKIELL